MWALNQPMKARASQSKQQPFDAFPVLQRGVGGQRLGKWSRAVGALGRGQWSQVLSMIPKSRRGGLPPSHQTGRLGTGMDLPRTRQRGMDGRMRGIPPWG